MTTQLRNIDISKSITIDIGKQAVLPQTLRVVDLQLGWQPYESEPVMKDNAYGGLGGLVNAVTSKKKHVDVDASVFLVDARERVLNRVCFTNLSDGRNQIFHSGDNLTGEGSYPDETIHIKDLRKISPEVAELHFWVNIFSGSKDFGSIRNCRAGVVNVETRQEFCGTYLTGDHAGKSSILIGAISRHPQDPSTWVYTSICQAYNENRLADIISNHYKGYA